MIGRIPALLVKDSNIEFCELFTYVIHNAEMDQLNSF
jgi:hypothetical protein